MSNSSKSTLDFRRLFSYVFIFALAMLFALEWGPGSRGCDRAGELSRTDSVATVNGREIPVQDFRSQYSVQLDALRRQGVPTELARQFGMHKQLMDQLVNTELLAQAAEARGLTASDEEVLKILRRDPNFQKNGAFDFETYQQVVRDYMRSTEPEYEARLRRRLGAQRMLELVEASVVVSEEEVKARYQKEGDAAKVTFVRFTPAMYANKVVAPKQPEIEAYVKAHEKEIADYYEQNKMAYFEPEKVKARQILIRVGKDDDDAKKAAAKAKAEALRKEIVESNKPFAEVAKEASEDVETKAKGGDLGFVERLGLPGAFADVLFALKAGEVTVPVETPLGFHLGTIEDRQAPVQRPLDSVRAEIAVTLLNKSRAKALAQADAEKALAEAKKGKTLAELFPAAAPESAGPFASNPDTKPEAKETGEFNSSADSVPQLGLAPELFKAVFARGEPGLLEQIFTLEDTIVLASVDERRTPSDADYAARKDQLTLEALKGKQYEVKDAFLKALKQTGQVVTNDQLIDRLVGEG